MQLNTISHASATTSLPTLASALANAPGAAVAAPDQFGVELATMRTSIEQALAAVRALDRTSPLTPGAGVSAVLDNGRLAVQALRRAVELPGLDEQLQRAAAATYPHLHDGIHLLEDVASSGAPARPELVLDAVDLSFTRAWMVVDKLLGQSTAPSA